MGEEWRALTAAIEKAEQKIEEEKTAHNGN
jgi:hypothetical protein